MNSENRPKISAADPRKQENAPSPEDKASTAAKPATKEAKSDKKKRSTKKHFSKNQHIVYPSQGIGIVKSIETLTFKNTATKYYILHIESSGMTIKIPVARAEELGLRPIVSEKEAEKALQEFEQEHKLHTSDWKHRYQANMALLKEGTIHNIANIVHTLYNRKQIKELPIFERKLYDSALQLLIEEISLACKTSKEEAEERIFTLLKSQVRIEEEEPTYPDEEFADEEGAESEKDDEDNDDNE